MLWNDSAIVIDTKKYGENSAIITVFSPNHGIHKGLVRNITNKKNRGIFQIGNIIDATWQARLADHLGNFTAELTEAIAAKTLSSHIKLAALNSICSLAKSTLPEREPNKYIYDILINFLDQLIRNHNWQICYIKLELEILSNLGFGLDLESCAATGQTDELIYVSPKSGRAVCKESGEPYKEKLLNLPEFITLQNETEISTTAIEDGLKLTDYFLQKYHFCNDNHKEPYARSYFIKLMTSKKERKAS